jgi:putative flippase GtrA
VAKVAPHPVILRQTLASCVVFSEFYSRARASAFAGKVTRYAIGSVIALATSIVVFALMYVAGAGTTACSVSAFIAGAIPNWISNRRWAWKIQGEVEVLREIVAYLTISLIVLVASAAATGWTKHAVKGLTDPHGLRVLLVTSSYVLVQAVLFVAKFMVYEHWVFSGRSRLRAGLRSRHQVWTAARANRTP